MFLHSVQSHPNWSKMSIPELFGSWPTLVNRLLQSYEEASRNGCEGGWMSSRHQARWAFITKVGHEPPILWDKQSASILGESSTAKPWLCELTSSSGQCRSCFPVDRCLSRKVLWSSSFRPASQAVWPKNLPVKILLYYSRYFEGEVERIYWQWLQVTIGWIMSLSIQEKSEHLLWESQSDWA